MGVVPQDPPIRPLLDHGDLTGLSDDIFEKLWTCEYCGASNKELTERCHECGAPKGKGNYDD